MVRNELAKILEKNVNEPQGSRVLTLMPCDLKNKHYELLDRCVCGCNLLALGDKGG